RTRRPAVLTAERERDDPAPTSDTLSCYATIQRPPPSTLFPYTTLFRSRPALRGLEPLGVAHRRGLAGCHRDRAGALPPARSRWRSAEHTSELQSRGEPLRRAPPGKKAPPLWACSVALRRPGRTSAAVLG